MPRTHCRVGGTLLSIYKRTHYSSTSDNWPWLWAICQWPMLVSPSMRGRGNRTMSPAAYTLSAAFMYWREKNRCAWRKSNDTCMNNFPQSWCSFFRFYLVNKNLSPSSHRESRILQEIGSWHNTCDVIMWKKKELRGAEQWMMMYKHEDTNPLQLPPCQLQEFRQMGWWPLWPFHPRRQSPSLRHWGRTLPPSPRASEMEKTNIMTTFSAQSVGHKQSQTWQSHCL